MHHTDEEFLREIERQPTERTFRLVYADWLDEHGDPRGELVRVEEEMRQVPVYSDRFWELKPRRNELRALVGAEWCGRMRYGMECEPVFRHGIPDGWRERWRLIREFIERWHGIPMPDIGGRQKEIAEEEAKLGRELPPSVREWIAYADDRLMPTSWHSNIAQDEYVALCNEYDAFFVAVGDYSRYGLTFAGLGESDPPVDLYEIDIYQPADQAIFSFSRAARAANTLSEFTLS